MDYAGPKQQGSTVISFVSQFQSRLPMREQMIQSLAFLLSVQDSKVMLAGQGPLLRWFNLLMSQSHATSCHLAMHLSLNYQFRRSSNQPPLTQLLYLQAAQDRLSSLPPSLWAQVASHLPQDDILTMRGICRHFANLSHLEDLALQWQPGTSTHIASLALFVTRVCQNPSAPRLHVTVSSSDAWSCALLATTCSMLRSFDTGGHGLDTDQARFLIRALPPQLEDLHLQAPAPIVEDSSWRRFSALTRLSFHCHSPSRNASDASVSHASALLRLPRLKVFEFSSSPEGIVVLDKAFPQPSLEVLKLWSDPFMSMDSRAFQGLQELECHFALPSWVRNLPLCKLVIAEANEEKEVLQTLVQHAPEISCQTLALVNLVMPSIGLGLVQALLKMPVLKALKLVPSSCRKEMSLHATKQEWAALLQKVQVSIDGAIRLIEKPGEPGYAGRSISLQSNGHVSWCMCTSCCPPECSAHASS